jgi:hypothetical protein
MWLSGLLCGRENTCSAWLTSLLPSTILSWWVLPLVLCSLIYIRVSFLGEVDGTSSWDAVRSLKPTQIGSGVTMLCWWSSPSIWCPFLVMCVAQHVTDLSGKETMARVTGMVPLPLFCSFCDWGVHDFLWPVNPNSQVFWLFLGIWSVGD